MDKDSFYSKLPVDKYMLDGQGLTDFKIRLINYQSEIAKLIAKNGPSNIDLNELTTKYSIDENTAHDMAMDTVWYLNNLTDKELDALKRGFLSIYDINDLRKSIIDKLLSNPPLADLLKADEKKVSEPEPALEPEKEPEAKAVTAPKPEKEPVQQEKPTTTAKPTQKPENEPQPVVEKKKRGRKPKVESKPTPAPKPKTVSKPKAEIKVDVKPIVTAEKTPKAEKASVTSVQNKPGKNGNYNIKDLSNYITDCDIVLQTINKAKTKTPDKPQTVAPQPAEQLDDTPETKAKAQTSSSARTAPKRKNATMKISDDKSSETGKPTENETQRKIIRDALNKIANKNSDAPRHTVITQKYGTQHSRPQNEDNGDSVAEEKNSELMNLLLSNPRVKDGLQQCVKMHYLTRSYQPRTMTSKTIISLICRAIKRLMLPRVITFAKFEELFKLKNLDEYTADDRIPRERIMEIGQLFGLTDLGIRPRPDYL